MEYLPQYIKNNILLDENNHNVKQFEILLVQLNYWKREISQAFC